MMRKRINAAVQQDRSPPDPDWLTVECLAEVEISSEDAMHPIESALLSGEGSGWRAGVPGKQTIPFREIVRQRWNFSPRGATSETEDHRVELSAVTMLELSITPDISGQSAFASLGQLRIG